MAINNSIFSGSQSKWGISEETTFGTGIADAGAYEQLEGPIPSVDYGLTRDNSVKNDGTRVKVYTNQYSTTTGGVRVISFSGLKVRRTDLCNLIYAVTQGWDSEGGSTPFSKVFSWGPTDTQPLFGANAGKFYSVGILGPIASYMQRFPSCILRTLTLKPDGDGRLVASGEWISGFAPVTTANHTGTWAYNAQNYYNMRALSLKQIAAADIVLYDWSITFNNHAVVSSWNSTGYAEGYALACTDAGYECTGSLTVKYDAVSQAYIADALAGTVRKVQISTGTNGQAGYLDFAMDYCLFDSPDKDHTLEVGQAVKLNFGANSSTSGAGLAIQIDDDKDQGWV